mmetsp:Transcript_25223/g.35555  ORF Transcript_25223/g.35555 Transcript_25223/m.35555 type:complete len:557 (+) Transcript_25223:251-1921(+)
MPAAGLFRTTNYHQQKRMSNNHIEGSVEILHDRLYYCALKTHPRSSNPDNVHINTSGQKKPIHFFHIDLELVYWNFFLDFGPLNLGQLCRFASKLNRKLSSEDYKDAVICFYSSTKPDKRANAVFLMCAWQVLYLGRTPEEAYRGFKPVDSPTDEMMALSDEDEEEDNEDSHMETKTHHNNSCSSPPQEPYNSIAFKTLAPFPPFHDASPCACTYELTILDCLHGLTKARMYGFFDFDNFDVDEYEHFEQVENGDLNWIIQNRIVAFAGPHYKRNVSPEGYCTLTPADYIPYFTKRNVGLVVRLNKKCYDEKEFQRAGINFLEQYYLDGSCPPMKILNRVVAEMEKVPSEKAIAVHCKAGLGRTGTCIGAYIMKHYKFTAAEVIGWMRICRPGMVIGPQQHFLQEIEKRMWHEGNIMNMKPQIGIDVSPITSRVTRSRSGVKEEGVEVIEDDNGGCKIMTTVPTLSSTSPASSLSSSSSPPHPATAATLQGVSALHFGSLSVKEQEIRQHMQHSANSDKKDAVLGRSGQADGLLARRAQTQQEHHTSSKTSSWSPF